eukprot:871990-Pleurochrysis_carterae.AAC.1
MQKFLAKKLALPWSVCPYVETNTKDAVRGGRGGVELPFGGLVAGWRRGRGERALCSFVRLGFEPRWQSRRGIDVEKVRATYTACTPGLIVALLAIARRIKLRRMGNVRARTERGQDSFAHRTLHHGHYCLICSRTSQARGATDAFFPGPRARSTTSSLPISADPTTISTCARVYSTRSHRYFVRSATDTTRRTPSRRLNSRYADAPSSLST